MISNSLIKAFFYISVVKGEYFWRLIEQAPNIPIPKGKLNWLNTLTSKLGQ